MGNDCSVSGFLSHFDRIESFRQGSDLVYLDQNGVCDTLFDTFCQSLCICHEQIVSYQLDLAAQSVSQDLPSIPVIFCQTVFDGNNRILVTEHFIVRNHFFCSSAYAFACQVVNIVFCIIEFTCSNVQCDPYIVSRLVTSLFDGFDDHLDRFFVCGQVRCESAFITNCSIHALALQYALQVVEYFRTHSQSFSECWSAYRHDHEFLDIHSIVRMGTAV